MSFSFTAGVLRVSATSLAGLLIAWPCTAATSGPYVQWIHASNGSATERNLGRNFVHAGWLFENGFRVSAGAYFAGEEHCFGSVTFGSALPSDPWQASLTTHAGGYCAIDGHRVRFEANSGLCLGRRVATLADLSVAIGGCVWRHPDYTIGNPSPRGAGLDVTDSGAQLTAMFSVRYGAASPSAHENMP